MIEKPASKVKNNSCIYCIYILLSILGLIYIYLNCNYSNIWYDEGFSVFLIKKSYSEIWSFTTTDVHPPLFYWILKFLSSIVGESTKLLHFTSAIPFVLLFLLSVFVISKTWSHKVAILFILFTFVHHSTLYPISDIRMYSWSAFFVVATFAFGWQYIAKGAFSSLAISTLSAICAAYTHYYALISIFYIYLFLIIYTFVYQRKLTIKIILAAFVAFLAYIPWLSNLLSQVSTVIEGYWILDIDMRAILKAINPFFNHLAIGVIFIFALIIYTCVKSYIQHKKLKQLIVPLALIALTFLPSITGIIFSYLYRPVYIERYLLCSYLLFFLGIAILLSTLDFKKAVNILLISILFIGMGYKTYGRMKSKIQLTRNNDLAIFKFLDFTNKTIDQNSAFIYRDTYHVDMHTLVLAYPTSNHISKQETLEKLIQTLDIIPHKKISSYAELATQYNRIFYFDSVDYSLLASKTDSADIVQYFKIEREEKFQNKTFFELIKKE